MTPGCERYLNDPENEAAHLADCPSCAALAGELQKDAGHDSVEISALPVAPWEGAAHRSWPLVITIALTVVGIAATLFFMAGVSPLRGLTRAIVASMPPLDILLTSMQLAGSAVHGAPTMWQLAIGAGVIIVNTALVVLLRRAPKGIDA